MNERWKERGRTIENDWKMNGQRKDYSEWMERGRTIKINERWE